jgi:uncharacterized protein YqjF (DUF2071 family)
MLIRGRAAAAGRPLFLADWTDVVFVHYRIADAGRLQRRVPLELDRCDGDAYVSLVAFSAAFAPRSAGDWRRGSAGRWPSTSSSTSARTSGTAGRAGSYFSPSGSPTAWPR